MTAALHRHVLALAVAAGLAVPAAAAPGRAAAAPPARRGPAAPHAPARPAAPGAHAAEAIAARARAAEDEGRYVQALAALRELRPLTRTDADLELEIALDLARTGRPDSAWAIVNSPLLLAALADSLPMSRWRPFGSGREGTWLDGVHDGWHWYVARARAELALRLGLWDDARAAAQAAVRARPMSGRDHLLLAVAAGRAGQGALARAEAERAALIDPLLPEAHYLSGLWAWRAGDRAAARAAFEAAVACDSSSRDAALALVRLLLPGAAPDSLPRRFLRAARGAGTLISPSGPKIEETTPYDQLPTLSAIPTVAPPDSVRSNPRFDPAKYIEATLLVDENGRAVLVEFPYDTPERMPAGLQNALVRAAPGWRFRPAVRLGHPMPMWINVEIDLKP